MILSGIEGNAHRSCKEALASAIRKGMEWLYIHHETMDTIHSYRLKIDGLKPLVECSYPHVHENMTGPDYAAQYGTFPQMIFDVGLANEAGAIVAALEVSNSHWLDDSKKMKLAKAGIVSIEVAGRTQERPLEADRVMAKSVLVPTGHKLAIEMWAGARWAAI